VPFHLETRGRRIHRMHDHNRNWVIQPELSRDRPVAAECCAEQFRCSDHFDPIKPGSINGYFACALARYNRARGQFPLEFWLGRVSHTGDFGLEYQRHARSNFGWSIDVHDPTRRRRLGADH